MSYDEDREIALITLSQSQRSFLTMTIIDTTLYANGALRLARHGAGRGETVLQRTDATGFSITVPDALTEGLVNNLEAMLEEDRLIAHIWDDLIELYQDDIDAFAPH